jgi:MSHA biogenesis protein MshP
MKPFAPPTRQRGSLIIMGIFLLVILAGLVVYLTSVTTTTQAASAADASSARAYQAARAGIEWATFQVLRNSGGSFTTTTCPAGTSVNLPALGSTLSGYVVTVTCTRAGPITEGASTGLLVYKFVANACNIPNGSTCPNTASVSATYVERELSATLSN